MSQSLAMVATQFLDRQGLASSTVKSYESALIPLLKDYGRCPIELMDRQTLQEFLDDIQHLSYRTHHRHQAIVHALFSFAVMQGYLTSNPMAQIPRRKPESGKGEHHTDQKIRYFTEPQRKEIYRLVKRNSRLNALIHLLHSSGARVSEILNLDYEAFDPFSFKFQVIGKGNKQRWCFYDEKTAESLARYFRYARHSESSALFTAQHRLSGQVTRLSYRTAYSHWRNAIDGNKEFEGARLHDLRHTFATERVGLMGIEELRALMGHENIKTTLQYQKVTSKQAEKAASKAFNLLNAKDD